MSLPSLMTDRVETPLLTGGPGALVQQGGSEGSSAITLRDSGERNGSRPHFPIASTRIAPSSMAPSPTPSPVPLIDRQAALSRMGDDLELLQEMAAMFIRDVPRLMADLVAALEAEDADEAARAAHSIKGLASNFGALPCMEAALVIEDPAKLGQLAGLKGRLPRLAEQVDLLCGALRKDVLE